MNDDQLKEIMTTLDIQDLREAFETSLSKYPHDRIGAYLIAIVPPKEEQTCVINASGNGYSLSSAITTLLMNDDSMRRLVMGKITALLILSSKKKGGDQ